jgi:hypothetical protein
MRFDQLKRREFITLLGGVALIATACYTVSEISEKSFFRSALSPSNLALGF